MCNYYCCNSASNILSTIFFPKTFEKVLHVSTWRFPLICQLHWILFWQSLEICHLFVQSQLWTIFTRGEEAFNSNPNKCPLASVHKYKYKYKYKSNSNLNKCQLAASVQSHRVFSFRDPWATLTALTLNYLFLQIIENSVKEIYLRLTFL